MNKGFVAVVTLILSLLLTFGVAAQEERSPGIVVASGTTCHYGQADDFAPWGNPLPVDMQVTILGQQPWEGWTLIAIGDTVGEGCLVEFGAVKALEDSTGGTLEVIGLATVTDSVYCRTTASGDGEIRTTLVPGQVVTELADGEDDGWQLVGLEATMCYVSAEYLDDGSGDEASAEQPEVEAPPSPPVQQEVDPPATVNPDETVPVVSALPNTGSGPLVSRNAFALSLIGAATSAFIGAVATRPSHR